MVKIMFAQELFPPIQSTQCPTEYLKKSGHLMDVAIGIVDPKNETVC